jgi:hypothetical protein
MDKSLKNSNVNNQLQINNLPAKPKINWNKKLQEIYSQKFLSSLTKEELKKLKRREKYKTRKVSESKEQREERLLKKREKEKIRWEKKKQITNLKANEKQLKNNSPKKSPYKCLSDHNYHGGFCYCSACNKSGPSHTM